MQKIFTWVSRPKNVLAVLIPVVGMAGCRDSTEESAKQTAAHSAEEDARIPVSEQSEVDPTMIAPSALREQLGLDAEEVFLQRVGGRIVSAVFTKSDLRDLSPLKGLMLRSLRLEEVSVADLSPLQGMKLEEVALIKTGVSDLTPLSGAPIRSLVISESPVEDISPLEGMPLDVALFLDKTKVEDISVLSGYRAPKLYLTNNPIRDMAPLGGKTFEELDLSGTQVEDLAPVRGMKLGILWLRRTPVADLNPIREAEITSLDVQDTKVSDVTPLAGLPSLARLNIAGTQVSDVTPLAGLQLTRLIFTPSRIEKGMDVIRKMPTLRQLDVAFEPERSPTLTPEEFWSRYDAGEFSSK